MGFVAANGSVTGSVLVADADIDTRMLYCHAFAARGWPCFQASDGQDALVQTLTRRPSLCVTELWLPIIDGIALCRELRRDASTASLPILVVTTESRVDRIAQAYDAGANAVLGKPAELETVVEAAARLIVNAQSLRARVGEYRQELAAAREKSRALRAEVGETIAKARRSRTHSFSTTTPNTPPLPLPCPYCDQLLAYQLTHYGGVSERHAERWDTFQCLAGCAVQFEYRFRTRKLRQLTTRR